MTDAYEQEIFEAFERGQLGSIATQTELAKFHSAARATVINDRRSERNEEANMPERNRATKQPPPASG